MVIQCLTFRKILDNHILCLKLKASVIYKDHTVCNNPKVSENDKHKCGGVISVLTSGTGSDGSCCSEIINVKVLQVILNPVKFHWRFLDQG